MTAKERWTNWHWTTRAAIVLGLIGAAWTVLTAAYGAAGMLFVTRPAFERYVQHRDSIMARYLYQRDSTQAIQNERREVFETSVVRFMKRDCIRHHGTKACLD